MNSISITAAAVLLSVSAAALATTDSDDQRQLHGMDVIGNRELPKALYVVPWQSAELGESTPSPFSGVFGEGLNPLDPQVFQRELDYYQAMQD